jgi:hypothetical protein
LAPSYRDILLRRVLLAGEQINMGATYYVISISTADQYPWAADPLQHYDMLPKSPSEPGRNPTPNELREVLDGLQGYTIEYMVSMDNWQAVVEAKKGFPLFRSTALVDVIDFQGDEMEPHVICFEKGDLNLNILLVERLSRKCGTLLIVPDTGAKPFIVSPGMDHQDAIKDWEVG